MAVEEWYAMDKKSGMKFRTPDGKVGRLVSVHKDGATLISRTAKHIHTLSVASTGACSYRSRAIPCRPSRRSPVRVQAVYRRRSVAGGCYG